MRVGGELAVTVYGVLMYADGFIQPLLYGMCDSLQPSIGANWGARRFDRVRAIERCCLASAAAVSLASTAVLALVPGQLAALFMSDAAPAELALAAGALRLFSLTYVTRWVSFAVQSYFLAVEKPLPASIVSVCTAFVFPSR